MQIWIRPVSLIWILFSSHMKRGLMDQFENTLCNTSGKKKGLSFWKGIFLSSTAQREIYVSFVWDWRDNHSLAICILSGWESFPWSKSPINWNHCWNGNEFLHDAYYLMLETRQSLFFHPSSNIIDFCLALRLPPKHLVYLVWEGALFIFIKEITSIPVEATCG